MSFLICSLIVAGCSRSNEAEVAKAKAEAEAAKAKAEAELAKLELERLRAAQSKPEPAAKSAHESQTPAKTTAKIAKSESRNSKSSSPPQSAGKSTTPPPGPLVFEHTLQKPGFKKLMTVAHGQYGAQPKLDPGVGVKLTGGHTAPAVWAKQYLGVKYRVEFEMMLDNEYSWAVCVLNGPGYGNGHNAGYGCRVNVQGVTLLRDGKEEESVEKHTPHGEWAHVEANVNGGSIEVLLNGVPVAAMEDAEPLTGPANGWFGLVGREVTFRNLQIWSPESDTTRERQLTPPKSEKLAANGKLLYELNLSGNELGKEWYKTQPEHTNVQSGVLILQGPNGSPHVVLDKALEGDLACEVEFEYRDAEAVNFGLALLFLPKAPESIEEINQCEAVQVALPNNQGSPAILWQKRSDGAQGVWREGELLSSTGYFAPIPDRKYVARIEAHGGDVRLFLDGGLLLKAKRSDAPSASQAFFSMRQIYGGSAVRAVRIFQLDK